MSQKEKKGPIAGIGRSGYYARVVKQRGGGYLVEFPDLRGCLTEGKTIRDALDHAREALSGWLFVAIRKGDEIPPGRVRRGRGYHLIVLENELLKVGVARSSSEKGSAELLESHESIARLY